MARIGLDGLGKNNMVALLKVGIIVASAVAFTYAAGLAFQGTLETAVMVEDLHELQTFLTGQVEKVW